MIISVTQELLPLGASLQRRSQEVGRHVGQLSGVSVAVDGSLQHVVTAHLLRHVVLRLPHTHEQLVSHTSTPHRAAVLLRCAAQYLGSAVASARALRMKLHQRLERSQRLLQLTLMETTHGERNAQNINIMDHFNSS